MKTITSHYFLPEISYNMGCMSIVSEIELNHSNSPPNNVISPLRDSTLLVSAEFFAISFGLLSQIILTRGLKTAEFGMWILLFDLGLTIFMLTDTGLSTLISREIPRNKRHSLVALKSIVKTQILFSLIAISAITLLAPFLWDRVSIFAEMTVILVFIGTWGVSISPPYRTFLRSTGKASWEAVFRVSERMVLTLGFLLVLENGGDSSDFAIVIAIVPLITSSLLILSSFGHATRISNVEGQISREMISQEQDFTMKKIIQRALPFFIFIAALQLLDRADKFILAFHVPLDYIATYGISLMVYFSGMTVIRVIRNVIMPWLSEVDQKDQNLVKRYNQATFYIYSIIPLGIMTALLIMLTIPIVIFPEDLIYPNHEKFSSESVFRFLLITWSLNMVVSPAWEAIRAFRKASLLNSISISGLISSVIFGVFFIPILGIYAAAMMTIVAPMVFLFLTHFAMESGLKKALDRSYFRIVSIMTLFSFCPLILFIPGLSTISGFTILLCASLMVEITLFSSRKSFNISMEN
tara:strand:+ start:9183 stop:10757 length:1575 start_codon:yes stop_codon:yes gene_type:complete